MTKISSRQSETSAFNYCSLPSLFECMLVERVLTIWQETFMCKFTEMYQEYVCLFVRGFGHFGFHACPLVWKHTLKFLIWDYAVVLPSRLLWRIIVARDCWMYHKMPIMRSLGYMCIRGAIRGKPVKTGVLPWFCKIECGGSSGSAPPRNGSPSWLGCVHMPRWHPCV